MTLGKKAQVSDLVKSNETAKNKIYSVIHVSDDVVQRYPNECI